MNTDELEARDTALVKLFQQMVLAFEGHEEGLSQALNLMAVTLTPPEPGPVPTTIEGAIKRRQEVAGENEETGFPYTDTQKAAILALFEYANTHQVDMELATHLIESYSSEMRGGRRRRGSLKGRKSRKGRKPSKRPKSRRRYV